MLGLVKKIQPRIAVLDDEPKMSQALCRLLKTHDFETVSFTFAEDLFADCASGLPDCLLLDLQMPGVNGFEVLERLAAQRTPMPVIVITGHDQPDNAEKVRALGAVDYLLKPIKDETLMEAIKSALNRQPPGKKHSIAMI
jgi:FixJ family two-component response regulator